MAEQYLQVNVYRGSGRWCLSVLVRTPGRPYPRLVRTLHSDYALEGANTLAEALHAASRALTDAAAQIPH